MKKAVVISAIVVLIGTGAYLFYKEQYNRLLNMQYKILGVKINKVSASDTDIDLKVEVHSNATLEAEVSDLYLDVFLNGRKIGVVTDIKPMLIPAKGYSAVELKVKSDVTNIIMDAVNLGKELYAAKDATITFRGTATIKSAFVKLKAVPINYTDTIKGLMAT